MIHLDNPELWIDGLKIDGMVSVAMKTAPSDNGVPDAYIHLTNAFEQYSLKVNVAAMNLRVLATAWGDPIKFAKRLAIESCGVTEIDIRRVDLDHWRVELWNGRKVTLP